LSFFRNISCSAKLAWTIAFGIVEVVVKRPRTRPERAAWLSRVCRRLLRRLDFQVITHGTVPMSGSVVCNHLSYIDIMVHSSIRPCVFVSKAELRQQPIIGWMSMMAGTVYVERGAGGSASKAAEGMAKGFRDRLPVTFFPEGTTFVGDEPAMPFRSGLIAETMAAGEPLTPSFLRYELAPQDIARGKTVRDDIAWGPQGLISHLWNVMGLHGLRIHVRFAEHPVVFSEAAEADRKIAAEEARQAVLAVYDQSVSADRQG
jgi:1-acyl-sn-glycerol-3-phosphate acyltransferase